jgi:hypothetical protein
MAVAALEAALRAVIEVYLRLLDNFSITAFVVK